MQLLVQYVYMYVLCEMVTGKNFGEIWWIQGGPPKFYPSKFTLLTICTDLITTPGYCKHAHYRNLVLIRTNLLFVSRQIHRNRITVNENVWNIKLALKSLTVKACRCRISYVSALYSSFVWGLYSFKFLILHGTINFLIIIIRNLFFGIVKRLRKCNLRIKQSTKISLMKNYWIIVFRATRDWSNWRLWFTKFRAMDWLIVNHWLI